MSSKRFVGYIRVSTDKQGQSGLGLEAQEAAIKKFVSLQNGSLLTTFTEVESGKMSTRPQLKKAMERAKLSGATLLVAKLDRLSRNVAFLATLMESGVDFIAADMPNANRLTIHIMIAVAEDELRRISDRTKAALAAAKARGKRLGNPNGAAVLRRLGNGAAVAALRQQASERAEEIMPVIEAIKAEGFVSLRAIAAQLDERGILTPRGGRWHAGTVRDILRRAAA